MKIHLVSSICWAALAIACGDGVPQDAPLGPNAFAQQTGLVLTTTYETGTVDAFFTDEPARIRPSIVLADGDAVIRSTSQLGIVLNRGDASNLQVISAELSPGTQVSLPGCGPHDVVSLPDGRMLITCYDDVHLVVFDPLTDTTAVAADLSVFADDDGIPEMDQMCTIANTIFVTVQRIDRLTYLPAGPGLIALIDTATLQLIDADPSIPGIQAITLPLTNPYTRLICNNDGTLFVGCVGDWYTTDTFGLVAVDSSAGSAEVLADGERLGGPTSYLRAGPTGQLFALVSAPNGFVTDEMRLIEVTPSEIVIRHTYPGFSLAGLAVDGQGRVFFGNRAADSAAGLWVLRSPDAPPEGPYATTLPPFAIELF